MDQMPSLCPKEYPISLKRLADDGVRNAKEAEDATGRRARFPPPTSPHLPKVYRIRVMRLRPINMAIQPAARRPHVFMELLFCSL